MALPTFSNVPETWDWDLHQGSTFGPVRHYLVNEETGLPLDLTGCTMSGQVRRKATTPRPAVATFTPVIAPAPADGWYEFTLTDEATAAISCGEELTDEASQYRYDIEVTTAAGSVFKTLRGRIRIAAEVTRPALT